MDFGSMARIAADGASLAATAFAVHATSSPTIDALVNAVTGGRVNNRSLSSDLLDGIMRFVGTHVPTLANLEDDEARLLQNGIVMSTSTDQDAVQRAVDGIIADAVTAPSQAILKAGNAGVTSLLNDLPVAKVIQDSLTSKITAFEEDMASRLKTHMAISGNEQASQKMLKAVVDKHGWVSLDKLAATLIGSATDGSALANKAALFGYGIVKRALDGSVVQNPRYATTDDSALQIGGTLFSTIAALAKVEGFTGEGESNPMALAAHSLSQISPELKTALTAAAALVQPAKESAQRTRALITTFVDSVANIETATRAAPKLKLMPAAAGAAVKEAWISLQALLTSMQETADTSRLALEQGMVVIQGLAQTPAAAKLLESNDGLMQAAQIVSRIIDTQTPTATFVAESVSNLRSASWYPSLIRDLNAQSPGAGDTLDSMLMGSLRLIDIANDSLAAAANIKEGGSRMMAGIGKIGSGLNPLTALYPASNSSNDASPTASESLDAGSTNVTPGANAMPTLSDEGQIVASHDRQANVPTTVATQEEPELQFIAPDSVVGRMIDIAGSVAQSNLVQGVGEVASGLAQTAGGCISGVAIAVSACSALGSALYAYSGWGAQDATPV